MRRQCGILEPLNVPFSLLASVPTLLPHVAFWSIHSLIFMPPTHYLWVFKFPQISLTNTHAHPILQISYALNLILRFVYHSLKN